jgi:arsenate reductase
VIDVLLKHKQLMQRPVVIRGNKAIIGRPKERVTQLLS